MSKAYKDLTGRGGAAPAVAGEEEAGGFPVLPRDLGLGEVAVQVGKELIPGV